MLLNWTPHVVRVIGPDLAVLAELQPAAYVPRLAERVVPCGAIESLPVVQVQRDRLAAPLPELSTDVVGVIVGDLVAPAVRRALDERGYTGVAVFTPTTGPGWAVREAPDGTRSDAPDAKGIVWGVKALTLYVKE